MAHFRKQNGSSESIFEKTARQQGLKIRKSDKPKKSLPVLNNFGPPCHECPKAKLYPENRGLHHANALPVQLYYLARRTERFGTMDGGYLLYTMSPVDAIAVMDLFSDRFPTQVSKQQCLELMTLIDQVATEVQSKREERMRERHRTAAENKSRSGRKGMKDLARE